MLQLNCNVSSQKLTMPFQIHKQQKVSQPLEEYPQVLDDYTGSILRNIPSLNKPDTKGFSLG